MRIVSILLGGFVICGVFAAWSCGDNDHPRYHDRHPVERQNVVVEQPSHETVVVEERPTRVIIVKEAPPPPLVEVRTAPPGRDYVWITGYYRYDEHARHHDWVGGHWVRPPHPGATWEPDRWSKSGHDYQYQPGHWK